MAPLPRGTAWHKEKLRTLRSPRVSTSTTLAKYVAVVDLTNRAPEGSSTCEWAQHLAAGLDADVRVDVGAAEEAPRGAEDGAGRPSRAACRRAPRPRSRD